MFPSILIFDFDLILGSFFIFGALIFFFGVQVGLKLFFLLSFHEHPQKKIQGGAKSNFGRFFLMIIGTSFIGKKAYKRLLHRKKGLQEGASVKKSTGGVESAPSPRFKYG